MQTVVFNVIEMMIDFGEVIISKASNVLDKPELRVLTAVRKA